MDFAVGPRNPDSRLTGAVYHTWVYLGDAYDAITVQDLDGRILTWNPGAVRMYGWSESEALGDEHPRPYPKGAARGSVGRCAAA